MKKIIVLIAWAVLMLGMINARAGEYANGGYLGGKVGLNISSAKGAMYVPRATTLAYILQGGYLQGGYIFDSRTLVLGVGGYFDWNPSETHVSKVTYGSRSFGIDAKVGLPLGAWLPYAKLGYGYSTGTRDLNTVAGNSVNATFGVEYKLADQWSMVGEYKLDKFGGKVSGTNITNKTMTLGFNYYFEAPPAPIVVAPVEEEDIVPLPVVVPVPVTDAPPI